MIRLRQVKINIYRDNLDNIKNKVSSILKIQKDDIISLEILKKSIDARNKNNIFYVYELGIKLKNENVKLSKDVTRYEEVKYEFKIEGTKRLKQRIVIVGSGPAGLFCAYLLAENGYKPIIIEQGEEVDKRVLTVQKFWNDNIFDINSNVQFGEGGAGTFSDGKLNTLVKDKNGRMKKVFEIFVKHGAPKDILYNNKPHIGTDILRDVVKNIRNEIIKMGGTFKYNTKLNDIIIENNKIKQVKLNDEIVDCGILILAIGNSARETFEMLYKRGVLITSKPFAVGLRFIHPQNLINENQYGNHKILYPATYKLSYTKQRGVYSFCMCPGGFVINASSESNHLVVNGMSNHDRSEKTANSAIVVTVSPLDFGNHPLDGIKYQKDLEGKAYNLGKGNIPIQLYKDFKNNKKSIPFLNDTSMFKGKPEYVNLQEILPSYITDSIIEATYNFDKKIKGFGGDDVILAGIETRTSSPVRIKRDEFFQTNIKGIFPCGEGSGYAGGITTSAMDGMKVAEAIAKIYKEF